MNKSAAAKAALDAVDDAVSKTLLQISKDDFEAYRKVLGEMVKKADEISAQLPAFRKHAICSTLSRNFLDEIRIFVKQLVDNQTSLVVVGIIERFDAFLALPTTAAHVRSISHAMRAELKSTLKIIGTMRGLDSEALKTTVLELAEKIKALNPC